ncbi:unnamed protein product [Brassicogethes aeneus]|uniref:EGF-like domain-containing protein n=1 Tax=Brassicogethes aeneus TaxID=1431903 RepID=A0A9P0B0H1_BRAAE|nr:unnamed protein product [Brassicogethes aeneus]
MIEKVIFIFLLNNLAECSDLKLISTSRTSVLSKYESYTDAIILAINIPKEISHVVINLTAEELDMSIFGSCSARNVDVYMKYEAPPLLNPDNSKIPKGLKNISRNEIYHIQLKSDNKPYYINITSPLPGQYIAATFLEYTDPRYDPIKQQGLGSDCLCYLESKVYIKKVKDIETITDEEEYVMAGSNNKPKYFKFFVPKDIDHAIVIIREIIFSPNTDQLITRVNSLTVPSKNKTLAMLDLDKNNKTGELAFPVMEDSWHYLQFIFNNTNDNNKTKSEDLSTLSFKVRYFSSIQKTKTEVLIKTLPNRTEQIIYYNNTLFKQLNNRHKLTELISFKEYSLLRDSSSDSFVFSYVLEDELDSVLPIAINVTSDQLTVLKFRIHQRDVGGTLQFIMAFKPRVVNKKLVDEPENHVIIACIRPYGIETPYLPNKCTFNGISAESPLKLNKTADNSSVLIPYPESGVWYASFRLFCDACAPCECPDYCQTAFASCVVECQKSCAKAVCNGCENRCSKSVIEQEGCKICGQCDGPCVKSRKSCNSSVVFDISSSPCVEGSCGRNGKCIYSISDGVAYSSCLCGNKFRGWDCKDDSLTTPYVMVVLELLLLVLSNLAFLPAVYIAFARKYYAEAISYFSICFFSTFYHACDAGENQISFCLTRINALQFSDFFCALLAIWMTLIAMADLPLGYTSLAHVIGGILLAFFTTVNKTSMWVFLVPVISGICIIMGSWYLKYHKHRKLICKKKYLTVFLPVGAALAILGLLIYGLLQTTENYKYLHSMWHVIMAVVVIVLLPKPDTFQPNNILASC